MKELIFVITFIIFIWFISQSFKFLLKLFIEKKSDFKIFVSDGGFPSTHTTFAVGGTFILFSKLIPLLIENKSTEIYNISFCILFFSILWSATIIRDAFGIRYNVQRLSLIFQDILINENNNLLPNSISKLWKEKSRQIKLSTGHTPFEVLGGIILGIISGYMYTYIITNNISKILICIFIIIIYFYIIYCIKSKIKEKNTI